MDTLNMLQAMMSPEEWDNMSTGEYKLLREAIMNSDDAPGHVLDAWFQTRSGSNSISDFNAKYYTLVNELQSLHVPKALELEDYEYMSKLQLAELYAIWKNTELQNHYSELDHFLNDLDLGPETDFDYDDEY